MEETTIVKEANATLKYARISARKVKIVADLTAFTMRVSRRRTSSAERGGS